MPTLEAGILATARAEVHERRVPFLDSLARLARLPSDPKKSTMYVRHTAGR